MTQTREQRPRILHAVSRMAIGGVQSVIRATLERADHQRFDYKVLCTKKAGSCARCIRDLGVDLYAQKTQPPWDPYQIWRLSRLIGRLKPDLVHVHMAPLVIPVVSACRLAGVRRCLIHHHSDYTQFWAQQGYLMRRWENHLTRHADAIVGVSGAVAEATGRHLGIKPSRIRVIYNGIEAADYAPKGPDPRERWGLPPQTPIVVQVSRFLETKRIEDFIEAAALVNEQWEPGTPRPAFVVIGGGPAGLREVYERRIADVKSRTPGIHLWLDGGSHDVPGMLGWCQAGVLASENEGFGQVILEYIAAGLPVAAIDLPAIREIVSDGRQALLTPPRNPEALAQSILYLLNDRHFAGQLAQNARLRLGDFTWQHTIDAYEALYDEILSREQVD